MLCNDTQKNAIEKMTEETTDGIFASEPVHAAPIDSTQTNTDVFESHNVDRLRREKGKIFPEERKYSSEPFFDTYR